MSPAMKEFDRLYQSGEMVHDGNPVMRWAMSNVVAVVDPADNIKPDKKRSNEKIDPVVSAIMAVGAGMRVVDEAPPGAYEDEVYI